MSVFVHDPNAVLNYTFDWSDWLDDGDTINSATVTASTGLIVDSTTVGTTAVTVVISTDGSLGARGLKCSITTAAGLQEDRTEQLNVEQR